jgi:hypothetical protein
MTSKAKEVQAALPFLPILSAPQPASASLAVRRNASCCWKRPGGCSPAANGASRSLALTRRRALRAQSRRAKRRLPLRDVRHSAHLARTRQTADRAKLRARVPTGELRRKAWPRLPEIL